MADELASENYPHTESLHSILGAHGASLTALQREVDHLRDDFRVALREQDTRLITDLDEKFGFKLAACEGQEERLRQVETEQARRAGAGSTHSRYLQLAYAFFCAVVGGVAGALGGHFVPPSH